MDEFSVYGTKEMMKLLNFKNHSSIQRGAKLYRETNGKAGIPNIQLNGDGTKIVFPKPMINTWIGLRKTDEEMEKEVLELKRKVDKLEAFIGSMFSQYT